MSSYKFSKRSVDAQRFSFEDLRGENEWQKLIENPNFQNLQELRSFDLLSSTARRCPRVFVSHRRADASYAERIAEFVCSQSMEYWLDVHNPSLASLSYGGFTPQQKAIIVAGIIEMALINCTHVLAVMTPATKGSFWVPYEYGRITDLPTNKGRAACWLHPQLTSFPEYLVLGKINYNRSQIDAWLSAEKTSFGGGSCNCSWNGGVTQRLPGE